MKIQNSIKKLLDQPHNEPVARNITKASDIVYEALHAEEILMDAGIFMISLEFDWDDSWFKPAPLRRGALLAEPDDAELY